jgi:hypothetical protein
MHAEENKRRTIQKSDIVMAVSKSDMYDFLIDIVPRDLDLGGHTSAAAAAAAAAAVAAVSATSSTPVMTSPTSTGFPSTMSGSSSKSPTKNSRSSKHHKGHPTSAPSSAVATQSSMLDNQLSGFNMGQDASNNDNQYYAAAAAAAAAAYQMYPADQMQQFQLQYQHDNGVVGDDLNQQGNNSYGGGMTGPQ